MTIDERISMLESKINFLEKNQIQKDADSEEKTLKTYSVIGMKKSNPNKAIDISSGLGDKIGGQILWNSEETNAPKNSETTDPTTKSEAKGYNKHTHSRFSGGALIKDQLEIVDYDLTTVGMTNPHSQGFWQVTPVIKTEANSKSEQVQKIGSLDLVFNPDTLTWGTSAYEIDVKKCYLVMRDTNGDIELDTKGNQKKSLLYNSDSTKTSIIWDENASCFRLYATFSE